MLDSSKKLAWDTRFYLDECSSLFLWMDCSRDYNLVRIYLMERGHLHTGQDSDDGVIIPKAYFQAPHRGAFYFICLLIFPG